jgi:hypothetical protein
MIALRQVIIALQVMRLRRYDVLKAQLEITLWQSYHNIRFANS